LQHSTHFGLTRGGHVVCAKCIDRNSKIRDHAARRAGTDGDNFFKDCVVLRKRTLERQARATQHDRKRPIGYGFLTHLIFPLGKLN
jgi:hypothetical protein